MKNTNRKGFTLVELVIVIAVIAILAGVLIGTFASVIKRANQSAEVQNIKNAEIAQKADDILKKIEDSNWFGWEDFETSIVAKITTEIKNSSTNTLSATEVEKIVKDALSTWEAQGSQTTDLTADQVKAIVENAIGTLKYEGVTEAQVRAIVNAATATTIGNSLSAAQVKAIVTAANENNLTAAQVAAVLVDKLSGVSTTDGLEEKATDIKNALSNSVAVLSGEIDELKNTINALSSADQDNVLFAKRLNVQVGKQGLNSSNVDTPYDVIKVLGEMDLATQTTGSKILFSLDDVRFFVVSDTNEVLYDGGLTYVASNNYKYWVFVDAYGTDLEYSQYLLGTGVTRTIDEVDTGLDVGKNTGITTINFDSTTSNPLVIRTNGGTLTIYAPNADIYHYGYAEKIDVIDVKDTSLHVNGDVDLIKVKKGHIELESDAQVLGIYVYNESTDTQKDDSFENIKITVKAGAEVPQLSRSAVEIDPTYGTKVCTLVTDEAKDIYLFQQGVYEQIKTVDEGKNVTNDTSASWADDAENNNDKTQTAAQQLANELNASFEVDNVTYTVEVVNREVVVTNTTTSQTVTDTSIVAEAVDQSGSSEDDAFADLPLKGDGLSWETAFEIYDYDTMQKISKYADAGYRYFKVAIEKTNNGHIDCNNWKSVYLNGSFDGNGVILDNLSKNLFACMSYYEVDDEVHTIKNMTINADIHSTGVGSVVVGSGPAVLSTFENLTIHGYVEGATGAAIYFSYGASNIGATTSTPATYTFKNCICDADIVSTYAAGFVFHQYCPTGSKMIVEDSAFIGNMTVGNSGTATIKKTSTWGNTTNMYFGANSANISEIWTKYSDEFTTQYNPETLYVATGVTITEEDGYKKYSSTQSYLGCFSTYVNGFDMTSATEYYNINTSHVSVLRLASGSVGEKGTIIVLDEPMGVKAVASLIIGPNDKNETGNYVGTYMSEEMTLVDGHFETSAILNFNVQINPVGASTTGVDGNNFNVVASQYGTTCGACCVVVVEYNANDVPVRVTTFNLK